MRTSPLLVRSYRVITLVRHASCSMSLRALGVMPLLGDLDEPASLTRIAGLVRLQ